MDSGRPVYVLPRAAWLLSIAVLAALALVFYAGLEKAIDMWVGSEEYGHALLIPLISGYLVWQRRSDLLGTGMHGHGSGVVIVLLALALQLVGVLSTLFVVQQVALLIAFYGLTVALVGWRGVRVIAVPLLLLVFMVPLPQFLLQTFSAQLQLMSSQIGVGLMRLAGISVYVEGNVIDLGRHQLQVAEACSGLRYLFPLMTLSLVMAYLYRAPLWKRAVVLGSSVPVTLVMNGLRVGVIGILVEHRGLHMAEGVLHDFEGWVVFMACIGVLLLEVILLSRLTGDRRPWRDIFGLDAPPPLPEAAARVPVPLSRPLLACAALIALFGLAVQQLPDRIGHPPERQTFDRFPLSLGPWEGRRVAMDAIYLDALKLDDYLLANYTRGDAAAVNLYVAWYDAQTAGASVHSPRSCLPGGGWRIAEIGKRELPGGDPRGATLQVNRALIEHQNERQLVYYWFQQRGRMQTDEFAVKGALIVDAIRRQRTDGALVRLVVPLRQGELVEDADHVLEEFAGRVVPTLRTYVPD